MIKGSETDEISDKRTQQNYGAKVALQDFHAVFENGIYGILGPNGAGKSTLMNILTDNLLRDSGRILCNETEITKMKATVSENHGVYAAAATII